MTRLALGLAVAALLSACADAPTAPVTSQPSLSATSTTTKTNIDETVLQFDACSGEVLEFHIRQQLVEHLTIDAQGTQHAHFVINDKGTTAIGTVTGRVWNQTGATKDHINVDVAGTGNETFTNSLNLIGRGQAPNMLIQEVFHITVNPKGVITVLFDKIRSTCK
ncbi:MAG: hypothetical protein EHM35_15350 [Planctomycetaceae bacterium]|nr:MAG: hypothetical protein EHM35_15350 [Planctomycetaceae bacterium]